MNFRMNAARCALWVFASLAIAACSSQGQGGTLPQGLSTPSLASNGFQSMSQALPQAARKTATSPSTVETFQFQTIDNPLDPTFNQLLGINDAGTISGYYGAGTVGHPNQGYTVAPPYHKESFTPENVPGAFQTQVTCIDNLGNTGGFSVDSKGVIRGFIEWNGVFTNYKHYKSTNTQILGLNNAGTAVGLYSDRNGKFHGFALDQATGKFKPVNPPGATNVQATAINNNGDVVGFYATSPSNSFGFIEKKGVFSVFAFPKAVQTSAFGVNDSDEIVGAYVDQKNVNHGFLLESPLSHAKYTTIDQPNSTATWLNGINNNGQMVGFYLDNAGRTHGVLVTP